MSKYREALARTLIRIAGAWVLLASLSTLALAQGVTGTVSGTVQRCARRRHSRRDRHAHQRHARHACRRRSSPTRTGDFVVPNVTADTYTIQVEMPSFRTLRRTGVVVSSGSIVALGSMTIEVGGTTEVVTRHRRNAARAGGERRAVVYGHDRIGRQPAAAEPHL